MLLMAKQKTKLLFLRLYLSKSVHKQSATNNEIFQIQSILRPAHIPLPCHLKSLVLESGETFNKRYDLHTTNLKFPYPWLDLLFFSWSSQLCQLFVSRFLKNVSRTIYWMIYLIFFLLTILFFITFKHSDSRQFW